MDLTFRTRAFGGQGRGAMGGKDREKGWGADLGIDAFLEASGSPEGL